MFIKFIYSEKATKFCNIFPLLLTVCTLVKSKGKISQNFVAFSEYMNFNIKSFKPLKLQGNEFKLLQPILLIQPFFTIQHFYSLISGQNMQLSLLFFTKPTKNDKGNICKIFEILIQKDWLFITQSLTFGPWNWVKSAL